MKHLSTNLSIVVFWALLLFAGCKAEHTTKESDSYVTIPSKSYTLGILDKEEWFEIPVTAIHTADYDRNFGVEVLVSKSSAIEGHHFVLDSHTVTIKAGEKSSTIRLKGIPEAMTPNNNLTLCLDLVTGFEGKYKPYNTQTTITLQRCCPFDINNFEGYAVVTSTWAMQYMNSESRLVHTHVDQNEEGVIVIEELFYEDYDIRIKFYSNDRLNPLAELCGAQVLGSTGEAFGTIYGNGKLMIGDAPKEYMSYYSTCEGFLLFYSEMYVEEVGTVGYFGHILEWISDDEAERIMREGF